MQKVYEKYQMTTYQKSIKYFDQSIYDQNTDAFIGHWYCIHISKSLSNTLLCKSFMRVCKKCFKVKML